MPPAVLSIIQALISLGPSAIEAINTIVNAIHNQPTTAEQEAAVGRCLVQACRDFGVTGVTKS